MNADRLKTNRQDKPSAGEGDRDALAELVRAAGRRPVPADGDCRRVRAASRQAWQQAVQSRRSRRRNRALAAGVAIVAIGAAAVTQRLPTPPLPVVASTAVLEGQVTVLAPDTDEWLAVDGGGFEWMSGTRLRTSAGGRVALDLSGGGSLRVNGATELTLTSSERLTLVTGTMYFDSGAATGLGMLEVLTSHGLVRKIGTQFEVMSTAAALRVRVREGSVEIEREPQSSGLTGAAGEQVRIDSAGAVERSAFPAHDSEWSWAVALADVPPIDGQPLMDLLDWVARETGHELRFADPDSEDQARNVILHGSLRDATPLEALGAALATTDFEHVVQDDGVLLIRLR